MKELNALITISFIFGLKTSTVSTTNVLCIIKQWFVENSNNFKYCIIYVCEGYWSEFLGFVNEAEKVEF